MRGVVLGLVPPVVVAGVVVPHDARLAVAVLLTGAAVVGAVAWSGRRQGHRAS